MEAPIDGTVVSDGVSSENPVQVITAEPSAFDGAPPPTDIVVDSGGGDSSGVGVAVVNGSNDRDGGPDATMEVEEQDEMVTSDSEGQWNQKPPFNVPPAFQGRSGGHVNPFNRGGGRGGGNFGARNPGFEQNWQQNQNQNAPPNANGGPPPQIELWVETKTDEGKSYFYHALTRETTWNKPEGPNVKVMTQTDIEEMNKKQQQIQQMSNSGEGAKKQGDAAGENSEQPNDPGASVKPNEALTTQPPPNMLSQPPPTQQPPQLTQPPPNVVGGSAPQHIQQQQQQQQPPPGMHQQPPPFFQPGMHPPNFQQPPFGMPPPGYGGFPGGPAPWAMPWNQHMHAPPQQQQDKPAKTLIIKPGVIDPAVIARAAEWSEHRAPDGRPYYYHSARGESVWEKPQALRDMEAARMAAHSGATPQQQQQAAPQMPPHLMQNPLMHMPPAAAGGYEAAMAYNAAAAAAAAAAANASLKTGESKAAQAAALEKESKKAAEEKRRKEQEEQRKSAAAAAAAAKPVDKSRPISSTPIAGTPWCVVWTGDARVFFYNPSTRCSVWERPEDLLDREDVDKAVSNTPEQLKSVVQVAAEKEAEEAEALRDKAAAEAAAVSVPVEEEIDDDDDEVIKIRTESESSVEEVPTKKTRMTKSSKKSDANEAAVEAEMRAAKERALVPLETRVKQFKEMLREKDVSAFSTWEKELHKIVFDPRYLLLTSKERKQVFEKYVKDRAEEERKEKRNKMRQKRDDFRKLMEEAKLHGKSSFSEFCQRLGKDDRYKAIEKVRERESLFNEYIVDTRRREKEEKQLRKEQIRKEFIEMLRERSEIDRHTRWHDIKKKFEADARYRAVESSVYREEYFQDYMRVMKDEKRKQRELKDREREREREKDRERRERERKSDRRDKSDRKSERKDKEERSRSRSRDHKDRDRSEKDKDKKEGKESKDKDHKDREKEKEKDKNGDTSQKKREDSDEGEHHDEDERHSASEDDEVERLQKERDRQLRAEQSIREREKEVHRTLAGHLRDRDKEREHHKRDEAIGHFNALLTDLVRNPDLTWKEVKRQLRKDHRWELIETLDRDDREKIFNEHIDALMKKKREKFREMLEEISTLELTSSWKDIKKLVKEDPRYLKYNNSEKCEREFRDYLKDKSQNAKCALRELLCECKLITHKSIDLVNENPNHLKEIQDILKNDKRYLVLEHMTEERTTIVVNYLEELHKRGPPPPPTASESTRRNK